MTEILYREFCNHIYLGQWELARAYAIYLFNSKFYPPDLKEKLISTIQWVTKDPYLARYLFQIYNLSIKKKINFDFVRVKFFFFNSYIFFIQCCVIYI